MGINTTFTCDECNKEIDIDEGTHHSNETDYARTEIVILKCNNCGAEYMYWTDGSKYFDYEEE